MKQYIPLLLLGFLLCGCYENFDHSTEVVYLEEGHKLINTKLTGALVDIDGNTMSDYTLLINDQKFDIKSKHFLIELYDCKKYGQEIRVEKDGKVISVVNMPLYPSDINKVTLYQWPQSTSKIFSSDEDQLVDLTTNAQLSIPSLALITSDGSTHSGNYQVDVRNVDDPILASQMGYKGYDELSERQAIQLEQLFEINIETTNGEALHPAKDGNAQLQLQHSTVGNNKALFVYNDLTQRWNWHSQIADNSSNHAITASGLYGVASYQAGVFIEGTLTKEDKPISYQEIHFAVDQKSQNVTSTLNGNWIASIPTQTNYQINFVNPCGIISDGPSKTTTSVDQKDISVSVDQGQYFNLGTQVFNCEKEIVDEASVTITQSSSELVFISDQQKIDSWVSICQESFILSAYDYVVDEKGTGIEWALTSEDQADYLPLCDQFPNGYSFIKIRNDIKIFEPFDFAYNGQKTSLTSDGGTVRFEFTGNAPGVYNDEDVVILMEDLDFGAEGYFISCQSALGCGIDDCIVSHYDQGDGWLRLSFAGVMWMQTINPPKAGNFAVEGVILCKTN